MESEELKTFWFFRRAYDSAYDSDFGFSLGHKRSYLRKPRRDFRLKRLRRKYNLLLRRDTIMKCLRVIDPEGVERRKRRRLKGRRYVTTGSNFVWHVDGWDKLAPFGIVKTRGRRRVVDNFIERSTRFWYLQRRLSHHGMPEILFLTNHTTWATTRGRAVEYTQYSATKAMRSRRW